MQPVEEHSHQPIADVVEACRTRLARGESIEACLAAYPSQRAELAALLPVVAVARKLAHDPDPTYAAGARRRFRSTLAVARENRAREKAARYRGPFGFLRRLAVPLVLVLILSASGLGLVQASEPALPDSPLYSVKQAGERVGQVLARTPQDSAVLQLRLANRRWADFQLAMREKKGMPLLENVATSMVNAANSATEQELTNQGPNRAAMIAELRGLLPRELAALNILAGSPRVPVARVGQNLQRQLLADEQKLAAVQ